MTRGLFHFVRLLIEYTRIHRGSLNQYTGVF